jgi:predicted esterase
VRVSTALALLLLASPSVPAQSPPLDRAIEKLWEQESESGRLKAAKEILRLDPEFDLLYQRLQVGRAYSSKVKTGLVEESRKAGDLRHEYVFLVPEDYDPKQRYRVSFYLHGGVNRREPWEKGDSWWRRFDRFDGVAQISVFPSSWRGALWWQSSQIENLQAILNRIKRDYNVDEERVYLFGVSDGATGVYYHGFKAPTPWAAFFAFIGHLGVLQNPAAGVDGYLFLDNLANKPFYIVNGETDELYPVERVRPYIEDLERAGVELVFRPQPGGHNTRFWNGEREAIEAFATSHPRKSFPDRLSWETERTDRFARLHWLVIDELAEGTESGRVDLERKGNVVAAMTRGVARFRLLLSPEQFDFAEGVEVVANGVTAFRGRVEPRRETLLEWVSKDLDRSMLFAAEVEVRLDNR